MQKGIVSKVFLSIFTVVQRILRWLDTDITAEHAIEMIDMRRIPTCKALVMRYRWPLVFTE